MLQKSKLLFPILFRIILTLTTTFQSSSLSTTVNAEPCRQEPTSNSVPQLTAQGESACTCCESFDNFLKSHEYVYLLFYQTASNRVNSEIMWKFNHLFQDWKYTKVAFGQVDVTMDKDIASQWLEPGQVPTNILFHRTQPVRIDNSDFEIMLKKYHGSPDGSKWLLTKYFGNSNDGLGTNLHYAKEISSVKKFYKGIDVGVDMKELMVKKKGLSDVKIVKWKVVAYFPFLTDQFSAVSSFRQAVWEYHHPPKKTKPSTHKPIECYMSYNGDIAAGANLGFLSDSLKKDTSTVRKNRDGHAVLRLYGLPAEPIEEENENETDAKTENDESINSDSIKDIKDNKVSPGSGNKIKYIYLNKEINFSVVHSDDWVKEIYSLLKNKERYEGWKGAKKEEL